MLQLNADGQNEFVKSYLQQREQLMSQQMEQKKRYEGTIVSLGISFSVVKIPFFW